MLEPPAAAAGDSKNRDAAMHKLGSALRRPSNLIQGMLPDALPKDVVVVGATEGRQCTCAAATSPASRGRKSVETSAGSSACKTVWTPTTRTFCRSCPWVQTSGAFDKDVLQVLPG